MPRASYYSDQGNPLQLSRVPKHVLNLAFAITRGSTKQNRRILYLTLAACLLLDLSITVGCLIFGMVGLFMLGCATMIALTHSAQIYGTRALRLLMELFRVYLLAALGVLTLVYFGVLPTLIPAILLSWQMHQISKHWFERCSLSPIPQDIATKLRSDWSKSVDKSLFIPPLAALLAAITDAYWVFSVFLLIVVFLQLLQTANPSALVRSLTSWLTYNDNDQRLPGMWQSPGGDAISRQIALVGGAISFTWLGFLIAYLSEVRLLSPTLHSQIVFSTLTYLVVPPVLVLPVLSKALDARERLKSGTYWQSLVSELRGSENPHSRDAYFMGNLSADGTPLLIDREVFKEHGHFLGSSGAGKTSKGLNPWIEQTIGFGDSSLVVIDLKGDSLELLATMEAAREKQAESGRDIPLKVFSTQEHLATHGFNPFAYPFWHDFNPRQKSDIICASLGLYYGAGYGTAHYSTASSALMYQTIINFPECRSFREYAECCEVVLKTPEKYGLDKKTASDGIDLFEALKRMADFTQLQPGDHSNQFPEHVLSESINLTELFKSPNHIYLQLPSGQSPSSAPAIARLFTYMLLTAATQTKRNCQVYLVIDEFQRMVAHNLDAILELARSMGIGIILANQSMASLKSHNMDLTTPVEANCRFRQWFDVPSRVDREMLQQYAGETIELMHGGSTSVGDHGSSNSESWNENILPRLNVNELNQISDDPTQSIIRLSRGKGYAQYAGFPITVRSGFHITQEEYDRRRSFTWPSTLEGTFVPAKLGDRNVDVYRPKTHPMFLSDDSEMNQSQDRQDVVDKMFKDVTNTEQKKKRRKEENDE